MRTSTKYKEFEKKVIIPLGTDDVRQDKQEAKKILVDFFVQRQFTVYSFVHDYFHDQLEKVGHGEVVAQLNCIMEVVKEVLDELITEFDNKSCMEDEHVEEIACSCENQSCEYRRHIEGLERDLINHCYYRNEWYHVIRRIAKFYENLHSVDNLISSNEDRQKEYAKTVSSITEDMNALTDDAIEQFSKKYDIIIKEYQKEMKSWDGKFKNLSEKMKFSNKEFKKISKNMQVANNRFVELSEEMQTSNDEFVKLSKKMETVRGEFSTTIISVMSIFAAAILATIVPMNFLNAVAKQIFIHEWSADATPVLIFIFVLFIMFNLIYFLLSYIATITIGDRCNEKFESKRILVKRINAVMLSIIAILLIVVAF